MGGGKASQTTDDFGQFTFKHARPGAFVVEAKSAGKGFGASGTLTVTQGVETKNIRVVLDAGVAFSGLVVDGSGAPVAGANVSLVESHGGPMESYLMNLPMGMGAKPEAAATSDAQGAFTMSGLKKGTYVLSAKHADFAPFVAKDVDVSGSQGSPYRIAMGKGGSAHGQYLVDGKPKANVMVQLMGASGMQMATTDSEGRFEVKGLAAGTYMVMPMDFGAMREGAGGSPSFKFKSVTVTEGGEIEIPFGQGVKVSGAVPADMLGKMTIVYLMRPGAPELPTMTPGMPSMEPAFEMMQYMAGFGMVGADGSFSVDGVDPGQYELRVYASNFNMSDIKPEEFMNLSLEEMQAQSQQYQPKEVSRQNVTVGTEPMEVQVTPAEPKP